MRLAQSDDTRVGVDLQYKLGDFVKVRSRGFGEHAVLERRADAEQFNLGNGKSFLAAGRDPGQGGNSRQAAGASQEIAA